MFFNLPIASTAFEDVRYPVEIVQPSSLLSFLLTSTGLFHVSHNPAPYSQDTHRRRDPGVSPCHSICCSVLFLPLQGA